jgi:hypothetical protein
MLQVGQTALKGDQAVGGLDGRLAREFGELVLDLLHVSRVPTMPCGLQAEWPTLTTF